MDTIEIVAESPLAEIAIKDLVIPPCPAVLVGLMEEAGQEEVDFSKIVKLISGDVGLAASMLKTANSPFFGLRTKAASVQTAVTVLGLKNILQIVRENALHQSFGSGVAMDRFWDRSNFTAIVAANIAKSLPGIMKEDAYTYGLFHDCGIPVLMQKFPDYKQTLAKANRSAELVVSIEDLSYSTNHAVVGSMMARSWFLTKELSQAILLHHDHTIFDSRSVPTVVCNYVAITMMAEHIVAQYLNMPDDAEWYVGGKVAMEFLGYCEEELDEITSDSLADLRETSEYRAS